MAHHSETREAPVGDGLGEGLSEELLALMLPRLLLVVHWNHPHTCAAFGCRRDALRTPCAHAHGPLRKAQLRHLDTACGGCACVASHNRWVLESALQKMDAFAARQKEAASGVGATCCSQGAVEGRLPPLPQDAEAEQHREHRGDMQTCASESTGLHSIHQPRAVDNLPLMRELIQETSCLTLYGSEVDERQVEEEQVEQQQQEHAQDLPDYEDVWLKRLASFKATHECSSWKLPFENDGDMFDNCCVANMVGRDEQNKTTEEFCCRGSCSPQIQNYRALKSKIPEEYYESNFSDQKEVEDLNCSGCYVLQAHEDFMNFYLADNKDEIQNSFANAVGCSSNNEHSNLIQSHSDKKSLVLITRQLMFNNLFFDEEDDDYYSDNEYPDAA